MSAPSPQRLRHGPYRAHPDALRTGAAGLLLALFALAQVLSSLHQSQERHVHCPEHDRVEHVSIEAASELLGESDAHEEASRESVLQGPESVDEHQGCELEPCLRQRVLLSESEPVLAGRAPAAIAAGLPFAARGHVQVALLHLAPKQSPPARV